MFLSNNRLGAVELDPLGHNFMIELLGAGNLGPRNLGSTQNRFQQKIGSPLDHRRMPMRIMRSPPKLVGMQGAVEVYSQTITVTAAAGAHATFTFPPYSPTARGTITWTVTIADPAPDTATARTKARKGRHEDDRERED